MKTELPPGFRFHPTDEELIVFYLRNQTISKPCIAPIIPELNIYKFDPWQLPEKSEFFEGEWYFFTPRDRKYPNGVRPNRATASGYWKVTGTDKPIYSNGKYVGAKKALVFYRGRAPKGTKTGWIMHEYRLSGSEAVSPTRRLNGSMILDGWVLCRIYQKKHQKMSIGDDDSIKFTEASDFEEKVELIFPEICSVERIPECVSASQLLDDSLLGLIDEFLSTTTARRM